MDAFWTVPDGFVAEPGQDFFQLEPPTPKNLIDSRNHQHMTYPPTDHPSTQSQSQPQAQAQLHPSQSHHSLRSSQSTSSLGGWSTVAPSEAPSLSDDDTYHSLQLTASLSSSSPNLVDQPQLETRENGRRQSCMTRLSIDPKLFAPPSVACDNKDQLDGEEDDVIVTAKPKTRGKGKVITGDKMRAGREEISGRRKKGATGGVGAVVKEDSGKVRISHARKQTPDHIPRPRNAFILFRKYVVDAKLIPASVETRHQNVSIITAKMWSEASPGQKAHFNKLATIEKEEHLKKYPGYRYQPVYRRTNVIRRRVRKDEAEEEKCKSVAELLIKGKSGEELEGEIKEKIGKGSKPVLEEAGGSVASGRSGQRNSSRKSSQARELSKGALRALRAQLRQQQQSGEWSQISRSTSVDPSDNSRRQSGTQFSSRERQTSSVYDTMSSESPVPSFDYQHEEEGDEDEMMVQAQDLRFGFAPSQLHHPGFQSPSGHIQPEYAFPMNEAMPYAHPDLTSQVAFAQPPSTDVRMAEAGGPQFVFPQQQIHEQHLFEQGFQQQQYQQQKLVTTSSAFQSTPSSTSQSQSFLYPQPQSQVYQSNFLPVATETSGEDYFTYDAALPFSPSATQVAFPSTIINDKQGVNNNNDSQYLNTNVTNDFFVDASQRPPMSARWDRGHLLPPSSEVPLEALPFDEAMLLGDFEAALAHADELVW
ncbi:hypothetical protein IAR55_003330 [Kwoniella newhampshirensis]|uniref:HMG box domain-containing protein n=1 Tax=Kwoniella newhampshirensis TaxID=1651941 RepID=A0AAW0YQM0_9TREE